MSTKILYGVKHGGAIFLGTDHSKLAEVARAQGTNFLGHPAAVVERVDRNVLPTLKDDGYKLRWHCQKCGFFLDRVFGVDANDFITNADERVYRYVCGSCVR